MLLLCRDYVHYVDDIFCKGAQIVKEMMDVSGGRYVSFHVRRCVLLYLACSDVEMYRMCSFL